MAKARAQNLKTDPLMDQYVKTIGWLQEHSKPLLTYLMAAAVLLALALIVWLIFSRRSANAAELMAEAFRISAAEVANPLPPSATGYVFTTQDEKSRKAYEAFLKAANDYPSYNGELGKYFAAVHQLNFEPDKAVELLKEVAQKDSAIGLRARAVLAAHYEGAGKYEESLAEYAKLNSNPGELPATLIKLRTARAYEAAGKNKEAADLYFELANDTAVRPTAIGTEAVTRLIDLDPARAEKLPPVENQPTAGGMPMSIR